MLTLKNINKKFQNNKVLSNINLNFKTKELVFILGTSGSGKSTLLNIIGKLLTCDSGEILLDEEDISKYKKHKSDKYRKEVVSYIFQEYNLIEYMSVIDNLTIIKNDVDKLEIDELLKQLSIYDKKNTKVSKLSGGEKQRVAIARAILKDSSIILCDEPTGALDSENSKKVIELLKRISRDKLVIVVSHDISLANNYADRIINIKDGKTSSLNVFDNEKFKTNKLVKLTKRKLIKISIKNILLNKKRTLLTSFASSIGIFCLILVSCLSKGFNKEIQELETNLIEVFPIIIKNETYEKTNKESINKELSIKKENEIYHQNKITKEYLEYINNIKEIKYITYDYDISLPLITDNYNYLDKAYLKSIPNKDYVNNNYEIISGRNITNDYEILIKIDSVNQIISGITDTFNLTEDIKYSDLLERKIKVILNDDFYEKKDNIYYPNTKYQNMYEKSNIELTIVGIVKEKEVVDDISQILYKNSLLEKILEANENSNIIKNIKENNFIFLNNSNKEETLSYLCDNTIPNSINIYVDNKNNKLKVLKQLDEYKSIIYEDNIEEVLSIVTDFTNIITIVLISFSLISLLVSSIMISILTNTRVIERKKEIGILRSLGASKKDIKRIFNQENIIISTISMIISIIGIYLLKTPINNIIYNFLESNTILTIDYKNILIIFIFEVILTIISCIIPIKKASNMDIVNCIKEI